MTRDMTYKKRARNPVKVDRLHGRGLPAQLDEAAYGRLQQRTAHPIWELRPDDAGAEGADYQLVRKREEPAVDLRKTASKVASAPVGLQIGDRVAWVRKGEVAPAIVINVHQAPQTADVEFEDSGETEFDIPLDMLVVSTDAAVDLPAIGEPTVGTPQATGPNGGDPFQPMIEPSSKLAQGSAADYMLTVMQELPSGEQSAELPPTPASTNDLVRAAQLYGVTTIHTDEPNAVVAHAPETDAGRYVLVVSAMRGGSLSDMQRQQAVDALHRRGKYA